ncbi:hypothetical protein CAPTEDRAFT_201702 [Capitella teleta]|uniref:Peptidase A2 domain-containing protein n=1 Tax=Capitella teleta TaxID=283909 RepID=R7UE40_CAPTE|nr:hypothetical protein CAPTEDRAFT_201702 [Capitella teleta]|eukprot:ELU04249.1 hypothetical protein CAPTEDRAFT_201702 [Capitella teleta]
MFSVLEDTIREVEIGASDPSKQLNLLVSVKVNGVLTKAVLDTASQVTVMSEDMFEKIADPAPIKAETVFLKGAAKEGGMRSHRYKDLKLRLGGKEYRWDFYVAPISDDLLLGLDFMEAHSTVIDLADKVIILENERIPFASTHGLRVARRTILQPRTVTPVQDLLMRLESALHLARDRLCSAQRFQKKTYDLTANIISKILFVREWSLSIVVLVTCRLDLWSSSNSGCLSCWILGLVWTCRNPREPDYEEVVEEQEGHVIGPGGRKNSVERDTACWTCKSQFGKVSTVNLHARQSECDQTGVFRAERQEEWGKLEDFEHFTESLLAADSALVKLDHHFDPSLQLQPQEQQLLHQQPQQTQNVRQTWETRVGNLP